MLDDELGGWAWAGSSPHQSTKLVAAHFGGTRTPLAVSSPAQIVPDKQPRGQFYHVNDIVPTIYDVLDITPPEIVDGVTQAPLDGVSMLASLHDADALENKPNQYFEVMGSRAYYRDGWIASVFGPRVPWVQGVDPAIVEWNPDNGTWELYDLRANFSQARNVAPENPEKLAEMVEGFDRAAQANQVYPVGGDPWSVVLHPEDAPHSSVTGFRYTQDVHGLPEAGAAQLGTRSNLVEIDFEMTPLTEGVLYALGAFSGGLSVWIDKSQPRLRVQQVRDRAHPHRGRRSVWTSPRGVWTPIRVSGNQR